MKLVVSVVALAAGLGLAACTTVTENASPASSPVVSRTATPSGTPSGQPPAAQPSAGGPNVTDPWAVVAAYYGDIESGDYPQAWALLSSGAVTGQTYQQFVSGFGCTGAQQLTKVGESGSQVTFNLTATDSCTGAAQHFTGTDTVTGGRIVAAHITGG
jgi:hypothetical protein